MATNSGEPKQAPQPTQDFKQSTQKDRVDDGKGQGPVSVKQRQKLIDERATPAPRLEYTIGGTVEQQVHTQIEKKREAAIAHINKRLQRVKGKARDSFNRDR
jgi:hypothetical protein